MTYSLEVKYYVTSNFIEFIFAPYWKSSFQRPCGWLRSRYQKNPSKVHDRCISSV